MNNKNKKFNCLKNSLNVNDLSQNYRQIPEVIQTIVVFVFLTMFLSIWSSSSVLSGKRS